MKTYSIWIEIEEHDDSIDSFENYDRNGRKFSTLSTCEEVFDTLSDLLNSLPDEPEIEQKDKNES